MHETEAGPKGGEKGVDRAVEAARATVDQVSLRAKTARKVGDRAAALLNANAVSKEESETRLSTETAAKVRFTELPGRVFTAKLARVSLLTMPEILPTHGWTILQHTYFALTEKPTKHVIGRPSAADLLRTCKTVSP